MKDTVKIKTCPECFLVMPPEKLLCKMCGHSFEDQKPDNLINRLTNKIAQALCLTGPDDIITLNTILHKNITPVTVVNGHSIRAEFSSIDLEKEHMYEASRQLGTLMLETKGLVDLTKERDFRESIWTYKAYVMRYN